MGTTYQDFDGVRNLVSAMGGLQGQLVDELDGIKTIVGNLAQTWDSDAQAAYLEVQQGWDRDAAVLNDILANLGVAVNNGNNVMMDTEGGNTRVWR